MSGDDLEIERKWRLSRLPDRILDASVFELEGVVCWRLRQAYLPPATEGDLAEGSAARVGRNDSDRIPVVGRIRSIEATAGPPAEMRFVHTLKLGTGLIRREIERPLSRSAFEAAWSATEGRRLTKTRWRIPDQGIVWEIDRFDTPSEASGLVLAEAEASSRASAMALIPPGWLAPVIDREVTDDPAYTNAEIAFRRGMA